MDEYSTSTSTDTLGPRPGVVEVPRDAMSAVPCDPAETWASFEPKF